jgi:3-oxoacyl-[acyl-carrier protein] reductase
MRARGGGSIIVTASIIARRPRPGLAAYIAAKTGVTGLARALALELAPDRIRVNVINPGPARTPMLARFGLGAGDDAIGEGPAAGAAWSSRRTSRRPPSTSPPTLRRR